MTWHRWGMALLSCALLACQAGSTPESSSSSHWFRCQAVTQCADAPAAVACVAGYCVDDDGQRIARSESDHADASEPVRAPDAAPGQIRVEDPSTLPDEPDQPSGVSPAAQPDAGSTPDAGPEPPSGSRSLRVSVRNYAGPVSGTAMVLHDAQGAALEQLRSDAAGFVESERATSMVTLRAEAMGELVSYLGLQPGDRLEAAGPWWGAAVDGSTREVYRASVPALPAGADQVKVRGLQPGCLPWGEGTGGPMLLESWADLCRGSSTALLATSLRTKSGLEDIGIFAYEVLGYSWLDQVATPQAGRIDDVLFPSWRPPARAEVLARNVPSALGSWQWNFLWWWRGEERFDAEPANDRLWFWHPPELTDDLEAARGMGTSNAQSEQWQYTKHVRVAPSARIEIDMSDPLPAVAAARMQVLDNGRLHVSWELVPGTQHADFALVEITVWTQPQPDDPPDQRYSHAWAVFVPPTLTSFTLPQLTEWLGFKELDTTKYVLRAINYYAADHIADYRAFINRPLPFYQHPEQISLLDKRGTVAERGSWIAPPSPLLAPIF